MFCKKCFTPIEEGKEYCAKCNKKERSIQEVSNQQQKVSQPKNITNHLGVPLSPELNFFVNSPPEIGDVLTAYTAIKKGQKYSKPLLSTLLVSLTILLLFIVNVTIIITEKHFSTNMLFGPLVFLLLFFIVLLFGIPHYKNTCTYVGRKGIARFRCSFNIKNIKKKEILLFSEVSELRTSLTHHYTNNDYMRTRYDFVWTDNSGKIKFEISGSYKNPKSDDRFFFGDAAERAWNDCFLEIAQSELNVKNHIKFNLKNRDWIRVGNGFIEFCKSNIIERWNSYDIDGIGLNNGEFTFKRKGAKEGWFKSIGVFKFSYKDIANTKVFLIVLEKLLGFKFN